MREFGTEQEDLGRIIDPDEQHDERGRSPIGRFQALGPDVPADHEFAEIEQHRGRDRSRYYVVPGDRGVGKPFEQHGEQHAQQGERRFVANHEREHQVAHDWLWSTPIHHRWRSDHRHG